MFVRFVHKKAITSYEIAYRTTSHILQRSKHEVLSFTAKRKYESVGFAWQTHIYGVILTLYIRQNGTTTFWHEIRKKGGIN